MSETIALGGHEFTLRPFKLGQLRPVLDALDGMAGKSGGRLIEAAARVVASGLAPAHAELTAEAVLELEATVAELNAAVAAILRVAGLQPVENGSGEARPVTSSEQPCGNSSAPSTVPSPPAAVTATPTSTA